jgi:CTP synthase
MRLGIQPDIIVCRSDEPLKAAAKSKISLFCDVPPEAVISAYDVDNVYRVPLLLHKQGLTSYLLKRLSLKLRLPQLPKQPVLDDALASWRELVRKLELREGKVRIALVGKYTGLKDSYISHIRALDHASAEVGVGVEIVWVDSEDYERGNETAMRRALQNVHGIIIPGGFGMRGIEGKLWAIRHARELQIPLLGICLGFQLIVIEFCRNVLNMADAHSSEFDCSTPFPVIDLLPEQKSIEALGGTMRLGALPVYLKRGTLAFRLYGKAKIFERHRHRYEVNPEFIEKVVRGGLQFSGFSEDKRRMEIVELPDEKHPFFIGSQFHPEFKSRFTKPAPLFVGLVHAAAEAAKG